MEDEQYLGGWNPTHWNSEFLFQKNSFLIHTEVFSVTQHSSKEGLHVLVLVSCYTFVDIYKLNAVLADRQNNTVEQEIRAKAPVTANCSRSGAIIRIEVMKCLWSFGTESSEFSIFPKSTPFSWINE